ncbi:trypsin-6-like [Schistocerca nitens]|uniref:trypsin-6-like n=1 Tax=Schistocerca nitens TaxID=7011 RepID=UPI00211803FC|nr:trypsin-6-like [Schistocerca nitens]
MQPESFSDCQLSNDSHLPRHIEEFPTPHLPGNVVTLGTESLDVDTVGTVVGWGLSGVQPSPKRMGKTTMVVVPRVECFPRGLEEQLNTFYCMRPQHEDTGACRGDSGGPFVVDRMQHGILWSGACTGQIRDRFTFTNPVSLRDWIASAIDSSLES